MSAAEETQLEHKSYTYQSGATYEGTFKGTKRHGRGSWKHPEGQSYEGEYVDNKQQGRGVYVHEEGMRYIGNWVAGVMQGNGVYYFNTARTNYYCGGYSNDKKHGKGYYHYDSGILAVQMWENGEMKSEVEATIVDRVECFKMQQDLIADVRNVAPRELNNGQPVPETAPDTRQFQFPSGATYTGQFAGIKKHGTGHWVHPQGDTYEGQFFENKHSGWGVYCTARSGKKYVGSWQDGKMHGWGIYFFNPEETEYFVGKYTNDLKDGEGMYHYAETGISKHHTWEKGELKKDEDMPDDRKKQYIDALQRILAITQPYAPHYAPVFSAAAQ